MTSQTLFWTILAAVLGANLLTVTFVWCCVQVSRREQAKEHLSVYLWGFLGVFGFLGVSFYIAMGGT
ncbi:hypothetical protein [Antarcticirhabdus aurantiaca]|uniref:Uncharacterized protein n=1 Tax=Antarcticirhabdus aurantiaca TaxID=2606717 RepID=A0ACD4NKS9_9HYPH|nr:hypothetical protein [Antarcticirhabdus aurantiaca]WAJ27383.1 hypothetical protein OXU80_21430 [Jeongeuplla avenae]